MPVFLEPWRQLRTKGHSIPPAIPIQDERFVLSIDNKRKFNAIHWLASTFDGKLSHRD